MGVIADQQWSRLYSRKGAPRGAKTGTLAASSRLGE